MSKTNPIKKIYDSKVFWVAVSLLASLAIWVYVTSVESDDFTKTFNNVRVELTGEDTLEQTKNMVITEMDTTTVRVEVTGPRRVVSALDSSDLVAQIDVSRFTRSAYMTQSYVVSYANGVDKSNLRVTAKSPDTVSFLVSELKTVEVPVRGSFDGVVTDGHTADTPQFEPSTVEVTGPATYVDKVSYAWVTFGAEMQNIETTYKTQTGYTLMNEYGEACDTTGFSFSTDIITAILEINDIKEVQLTVDLIEGAGANSSNTKVTIEPKTITLSGDTSILSGLNKIVLSTIDLSDFSYSYTDTVTIPIDNNLKNITGVTEAKITIEVVGLETRTFKVTNLSFANVSNGYACTVLTQSVEVTLRGPAEQLDKIKSESIRLVADLNDFNESTGTFSAEAKVRVDVDGVTDVGGIGKYTLSVEIRKV